MTTHLLFLLLVGGLVGAAAGYLGSFMVLKRMALVGDALSHVALPGMALAIMWHYSPIWGALVTLMVAVVGIWYVEQTSTIYPEALVGVFFTTSLALGVLLTPEPDLLEALFGSIEKVTTGEGVAVILLAAGMMLVTSLLAKKLLLGIISEELAKSLGVNSGKINLIYLALVGLIVTLGVRFVGTLLMGALVIIPAVSARNISQGIRQYYLYSIGFGAISALVGVSLAQVYQFNSGPVVVLTSTALFGLTYLLKRLR